MIILHVLFYTELALLLSQKDFQFATGELLESVSQLSFIQRESVQFMYFGTAPQCKPKHTTQVQLRDPQDSLKMPGCPVRLNPFLKAKNS